MGMRAKLKKAFRFSCSYSRGAKTIGCNYVLWLTLDALGAEDEIGFARQVDDHLIKKIHNHDLSLDVDFLSDTPITDARLVEAFYRILSSALPEYPILSLELERDNSTRTVYAAP